MTLGEIDAEVKRRADERTPELLVGMLETGRYGACRKHSTLLLRYIRSQVDLTRARRHNRDGYNRSGDLCFRCVQLSSGITVDVPVEQTACVLELLNRLAIRDRSRREYHEHPCECWIS